MGGLSGLVLSIRNTGLRGEGKHQETSTDGAEAQDAAVLAA